MTFSLFLSAIALVLVVEGMLPALNPDAYRRAMRSMAELPSGRLRLIGLSSMIAGAVILSLVR